VSKLSQAAAHPRRGTNYTRNGISCKEWMTCYTTKEEKAKKKNVLISNIYMQETMQARGGWQRQIHEQKIRQDYRIFMMDSSAVPIMKTVILPK